MFDGLKNVFRSKTIPHLAIDGMNQVTKLEYVPGAINQVNIIFNAYDLLGYEKKADTLEFFFHNRYLGRGYVADPAGVTVDITRIAGEPKTYISSESDLEILPPPGALTILAEGIIERIRVYPDWKTKEKRVIIPCAILEGKDVIKVISFKYLRCIQEKFLIDDDENFRYKIKEDVPCIDIVMPDGKAGRGYILDDETGCTVTIYRRVKVQAIDKEGKTVEVSVNFAGIIGRQATADKLTLLLSLITGRERMIVMVIGILIGQLAMILFHI